MMQVNDSATSSKRRTKFHLMALSLVSGIPPALALFIAETNLERIIALSASGIVLSILSLMDVLSRSR